MFRSFAVVVAAATLAPVTAIAATPVVGGTPDTTDVAVGQVMAGTSTCAGTLIAPTAMLTAAHCVTTGAITVVLSDGNYTATAAAFPGFNAPTPLDGDLAVLTLDHASTIAPIPFVATVVAAGAAITMVGFDAGGNGPGSTRQSIATTIGAVNGPRFEVDNAPNACVGDSGGPVLMVVSGATAIAGVISNASNPCGTTSDNVRTLAYLPWLASVAPGATVVGGAALPTTDTPPTIMFTRPGNGATMPTMFRFDVRVGDDYGALAVTSTVDGAAAGSASATGTLIAVPLTLTPGAHTIVATTIDASSHTTNATLSVTIEDTTFPPGQVGAACWDATDCVEGKCAIVDAEQYCTVACATDTTCPNGMYCDTTTLQCERGSDSGCGCTSTGGAPPWLAIGSAMLIWFGFVGRPRRR